MPALGFWSLFKYPNRCDEISRCRWATSEFPKCQQRITTLAININLNSYIENIKIEIVNTTNIHTFSKEHYKDNKYDKKLLTECHVSKKRKSY